MSEQKQIPFDLEAFKKGQKALTRDGLVATFVGICEQCYANRKLLAYIKGNMEIRSFNLDGIFYENSVESKQDLVAMVTRHQTLIDSYDPEDTWQIHCPTTYKKGRWGECREAPFLWHEDCDYRLHPHNHLIKAHKKGAKIENLEVDGVWVEVDEPSFYDDCEYRIKPEPTTKTVYEWMVKGELGYWHLNGLLLTEDESAKEFAKYKHKKTGRSWEVEL